MNWKALIKDIGIMKEWNEQQNIKNSEITGSSLIEYIETTNKKHYNELTPDILVVLFNHFSFDYYDRYGGAYI